MGTVVHELNPQDFLLSTSSAAPQPTHFDATSGSLTFLEFDASVDERCYWTLVSTAYGSGSPTLRIQWYGSGTATSGTVRWDAAMQAITPNTDTQDIQTDGLQGGTIGEDAHLGTTAKRLHEISISIASSDSIAAGDWVGVVLVRRASHTNDTLADAARVVKVFFEYSDT